MLRAKHVFIAAICLVTSGLQAQGTGAAGPSPAPFMPQQSNRPNNTTGGMSRDDMRDRSTYRYNSENRQWDSRKSELSSRRVVSISKLREQLTLQWQHMGIPADQAKVIASAYRGDEARLAQHPSLQGKSGQEVATMLQSALEAKNYRLANQLLIDYQRAQMKLEAIETSKPGVQ